MKVSGGGKGMVSSIFGLVLQFGYVWEALYWDYDNIESHNPVFVLDIVSSSIWCLSF